MMKRTAAIVLCVILLCSFALADTVSPVTTSIHEHRADASHSDTLHITTISPYDGSTPVTAPDNPSMADSVADILSSLAVGEFGAAKNVDPANVQEGIVRIDLDAVYHARPLDLLLVLDRSGSMNMWVNENDVSGLTFMSLPDPNRNVHISPNNTPCMNPDHYYLINYVIQGQTENRTYKWHPTIQSGQVIGWLDALSPNIGDANDHADRSPLELMIKASIGDKEIVITSIGDHYNAQGQLIPADLSGVVSGDHFGFTSPAAVNLAEDYRTSAGCFDRSMLARHMLWQFVSRVLEANSENRVGYTAFAGTVKPQHVVPYTSNTATLKTAILGDRGGDQHTNYKAAMESAATIFNNNNTANRKVIVFVSDGVPSPAEGSILIDGVQVAFSDGVTAASQLKQAGAEIYAVGVNSGALSALQALASDKSHAADCATAAELISHLNGVMDMVVDNKVLLEDTLGEHYALLVSEAYPLTVTNGKTGEVTTVTSLEALADLGITYDASTRKLAYTVAAINDGVRLSFYAQLDEAKRLPTEAGTRVYPTNASMTYTPVINGVPDADNAQSITVDDSLRVRHTSVTAVKDNGIYAGKRVVRGCVITYTITVKNTNGFELTDLVITDKIPAKTHYVEGSGGHYDEETNTVSFRLDRIRAGGTRKVAFQVKVDKGTNDIVNEAAFSVAEAVDADGTRLVGLTNEVVNPRNLDIPQTGDGAHPAAWLALAAAAVTLAMILRRRVKA